MHRPVHYHVALAQFIEENVLGESTEDEEVAPLAQTLMSESATRSQLRV